MSDHNEWNTRLYQKVHKIVSDPKLVFEIGAYDGSDIPLIQSVWPSAKIHAFEPDPGNYLEVAKYANDDVVVNHLALSNKSGSSTFYQALDCRCGDKQAERGVWIRK